MAYRLPNGQLVDDEEMRNYLRRTVTRKQIADWIDAREDTVHMMLYDWKASDVAFIMAGYEDVKENIIEFVEEDYDLKDFGIMWVDEVSFNKKSRKVTAVLRNLDSEETVMIDSRGIKNLQAYAERHGMNKTQSDNFVTKVYNVQVGDPFTYLGQTYILYDEDRVGYSRYCKSNSVKPKRKGKRR